MDVCALSCGAECVALCVCMPDNDLGAEGGAAVAEAMKSCKQLPSVNLASMSCGCALCDVCGCAMCEACECVLVQLWLVATMFGGCCVK